MHTTTKIPPPLKPLNERVVRVNEIDFLRGLVMIIMALDHTRDFIHDQAFTGDPLNLQTTTPLLYFTRWITHFCAPVFVFLSGTSIYLQSLRKDRRTLSSFLLKRGLWLVFTDIVIMTIIITFDFSFSTIIMQVIWAIGISMIILSALIRIPFGALLTLGLIIVFGHNLLDYYEAASPPPYSLWYHILHVPAFFPVGDGRILAILYPFLPWTGIMILGYCFGRVYKLPLKVTERKTFIAVLATALIIAFITLRLINSYGNPFPWTQEKNLLYTFLSFLNTQKYPPSLMYFCMTIGPALLFMALSGGIRNRVSRIITVFGRVPFFYYILHFLIIHLISAALFLFRGHTWKEGVTGVPDFPFRFVIPGEGYDLAIVYLVWILVVSALYPLCKWFSGYKRNHNNWWLSYL